METVKKNNLAVKKKYSEIIALYKLENKLTDVYVEGATDKVVFENYLKSKKKSKKILNIDLIDFSEIDTALLNNLDLKSNKNKLIALSQILEKEVPETKVICIIDKDFDDYIEKIVNPKLFRTDYSCLESYFFCEDVIDKFLNIGIGDFPFKAKSLMTEISNVVKHLFCLRLLRQTKFPDAQRLKIDGHLLVNKNSGKIGFSFADYLDKFLNKNALSKRAKLIRKNYFELFNKLDEDIRNNLNGHDLMTIMFLYINKIKNTPNYKEDNFCNTIFLTAETAMLEHYPLFQELLCG